MDMSSILQPSSTSLKPEPVRQDDPPSGKSSTARTGTGTRKSFSSVLRTVHGEDEQGIRKGSHGHSRPGEPAADDMPSQRPDRGSALGSSETETLDCEQSGTRTSDTGCPSLVGVERLEDTQEAQIDQQDETLDPFLLVALVQSTASGQTIADPVPENIDTAEGPRQVDQLGTGDARPSLIMPATPLSIAGPLTAEPRAVAPSSTVSPAAELAPSPMERETAPVTHTDPGALPAVPQMSSSELKPTPNQTEAPPATSTSESKHAPSDVAAVLDKTLQETVPVPPQPLGKPLIGDRDTASMIGFMPSEVDLDISAVRDPQEAAPKQEPGEEPFAEQALTGQPLARTGFGLAAAADSRYVLPYTDKETAWQQPEDRTSKQGEPVPADPHQKGFGTSTPMMVGPSGQMQGQPDPHSVTAVAPTPALAAASQPDEATFPVMSKSVVFEVVQSDLGRVQVRVAMTNDVVHTHFTPDRSDVGTLLWNGQDRLQTALQASGLAMGQFSVDVERHGAGRSFQQGPSYEQNRTGHEQSGRSHGDHVSTNSSDSSDGRRGALRGLLNLVA